MKFMQHCCAPSMSQKARRKPNGLYFSALKEMINIELALNPMFLLIGFSNIFGMLGFYVPFVYLPGLTLSKLPDLPVEDANFLLSVIGKICLVIN